MSSDTPDADDLARAHALLGELAAEIQQSPGLEPERRRGMLREIDEIRTRLGTDREPHDESSPLDVLEQLALDFEASHPTAADLVSRLSTMLANMGI